MADLKISTKRLQIGKANATIIAAVGIASFVTVSSLMFCKVLLSQRAYQSKIISAQNKAKKQLKANIDSVNTLKVQYKAFAETPDNIIGGSAAGSGDRDGDNPRIVLDALPSKYDFPALATSMEKLITPTGVKIVSITGSDDEVAQSKNSQQTPVEIPISFSVSGSYTSIKSFVDAIEKSIRPIKVKTVSLSGNDGNLSVNVTGTTYYRPAKTLDIKAVLVK